MGLAIGTHGSNISKARGIDGIEEILVDEDNRDEGHCVFKVLFNEFLNVYHTSAREVGQSRQL